MAADTQLTPGEMLVDLYVDLARARAEQVARIAGPKLVIAQAVDALNLQEAAIDELDDTIAARIARDSLHAHFAIKARQNKKGERQEREDQAEDALRHFVVVNQGAKLLINQVDQAEGPIIRLSDRKWVTETQGRLSTKSADYLGTYLYLKRKSNPLTEARDVSVPVLKTGTIEPQITVEFL